MAHGSPLGLTNVTSCIAARMNNLALLLLGLAPPLLLELGYQTPNQLSMMTKLMQRYLC